MNTEIVLEFSDVALVGICILGVTRRLHRQRGPSAASSALACHTTSCSASSSELLALITNVLGLISNFLTYLLRHSQVMYAFLLALSDCIFLTSSFAVASGKYRRELLLPMLAFLVVVLSLLHYWRMMFIVGELCGYSACLMNFFLAGVELSSGGGAGHGVDVVVLQPSALLLCNMLCSCIYMAMIVQEGEALYSSHVDFMRWYGNTIAVLVLDLLRMRRPGRVSLTV